MNWKKYLKKFVLVFGLSAVVLTSLDVGSLVTKADILEDTAEDNTEGEDDINTGNNPGIHKTTSDSTTIVHDGFSYYWYNNNRPNQKTKNGYYQTRYEYLDLPENYDKNLPYIKEHLDRYTHYENSVFKKYQENPGLLYMDAFGNIVIQSYSTDRNTNNFYRTIGYTFSRIKSSGVLNLDSKKISKRKEVPADKSWLKDDNFNVDDATSKDYAKLYGNPAEPHQLKSGDRETFTVWLPTEVITDEKQKAYFKWRHDKEGTSATYVPPSEYHKSHYESQEDKSVIPLTQAVYRVGIVSGRRRSINTFVYAADDLFGKYSDLKAEQDYPQSKLYRKNKEWYKEVREALKYNAAWFGVDAVVEVYSNGRVAKTATWRNPGDANAYANLSDQYSRYFRLGGRIGNSVETVIESDGMTLIKNKYDPENGNIPTAKGFTASEAIPHSSQNAYAAPKTYTYNTSNDFELGTAIPTTETYTNTIDDDTWYGSVKITKCTKSIDIDIAWSVKFTVQYQEWVENKEDTFDKKDDKDKDKPKGHYETREYNTSASGALSYSLSADCYAITNIDMAQLSGAIVTQMKDANSSWKTKRYSGLNEDEVPIRFIIPYKEKGSTTYEPTCFSNDDPYEGTIPAINADVVNNYYMAIPEEEYAALTNTSNYSGSLGIFSSYDSGKEASEKWARATADSYVDAFMKAWRENITNDTLYINGTEYLTGQYQIGQNSNGDYVVTNPANHGTSSINEEDYEFNGCAGGADSGSATLTAHMVPGDRVTVSNWSDGKGQTAASKSLTLKFKHNGEWELPVQTWSFGAETIVGDKIRDNPYVETSSVVKIPESSANGIYYTKLTSTYHLMGRLNKTPSKNKRSMTIDDGKLTDQQKKKLNTWPAIEKQLPDSEKSTWTYTDDDGVIKVNDPQKNEGIHVHTPVISPISIKGEGKTQLINQDESVTYEGGAQLILDNRYTLTFDWDNYFKQKAKYVKGYDGNRDSSGRLIPSAGWSKYLTEKKIRFPYSIEIIGYTTMEDSGQMVSHTVEKYFEPICADSDKSSYMIEYGNYRTDITDGENYTTWLVFPGNTVSIELYVPAWANEGSYVPDNMYDSANAYTLAQNKRCIQVEVRANNYSTETSKPGQDKINTNYKHHTSGSAQGEGHNGTKDNGGSETYEYYGASYEYATEVSGVIYGFQIDTINNPDVFTGKTKDPATGLAETIANLVKNKTEKNVGMKNRSGGNILRYTLDGSLVDTLADQNQKTNTLPLMEGKSDVAKKNGCLQRGNTFSFEVKTIADLDASDDKIVIKPSFRYYTTGGTKKDIALYYDNPGGSGNYIYFDNETDADYSETYLWDKYHRFCYYDYDKNQDLGGVKQNFDTTYWTGLYDYSNKYAGFTGMKEMARSALMSTKWKCSRLNNIEIPAGLRLFTANEEELKDNLDKTVADAYRYVRQGNNDSDSISNTGDYQITISEYEDLSNSMQTWYGTYTIPSSLRVVDVEKVKKTCEDAGYTYNPTDDPLQNYLAVKGSVTEDDDIFINDGYLVLNFDIRSFKDNGGYAHLQYYGDSSAELDMWNTEGGTDPNDPYIHVDENTDVPHDPGDVAIIELKNNYKDYWTNGVLYAD